MKRYFKLLWKEIFVRLFFHVIYITAIAALPYIIKNMIDCGFLNGWYDVVKWVGVFITFIILGMAAQYITQRGAWKLDKKLYENIRQDFFEALITQTPETYKSKEIGEYTSMINNDIAGCEEYVEYIMQICEAVIGLIVYASYIFCLDIRIACIIYITAVLTLFLPRITGDKLSSKKQVLLKKTGIYTNKVFDLLSGISFVNHDTFEKVAARHNDSLYEMEKSRYEYGKFKTFTNVLNGSVMYIINTAAFAIIAVLLCAGSITAGIATATISYIQDFMFPLRTIVDSISSVKSVRGVKNRIIAVIEGRRKIIYEETGFKRAIRLNHVSKKYEDFSIDDFSYTFEKGKKYAIIGPSGTGKSTLVKMIVQEIKQDSGDIYIDDKIAEYDVCNTLMFYIGQYSHIFAENYPDNVTMFGSYKYKEALKGYISEGKYGLLAQTDNCTTLSGGEKQLIVLERALLSEREILVLDEPFSALNQELDMQVNKKLMESDKTIIIVTHNESSEYLKGFDYIIKM